jgi:hypothetical protein
VSHRAWAVLYVLRALYARTAMMIALSYKQRTYDDWRADSGCDQFLRSVVPGNVVDVLKQKTIGGLRAISQRKPNRLGRPPSWW